jgi:hypothetical protein
MPDEKGNVTLEITLPQEIYDRVKRLAEDGVQDLFPMPMNRQPTTAEDFVTELLIRRLRDFGITADSAEVQTLKTELTAKQVELEKALKPRVSVVQKMADVVVAAVVGDSK